MAIMNSKQAAEFESTKECNFAISPPDIGRFRVNAFVQQSRVGLVLRTITAKIPKFEDLGLPEVLKDVSMTKRGLVVFVGGTGSGKSFAFGIPIVSECLRARDRGVRGIKALIVYPMNALANSQLGEVIYGGVGSGLYGMLVFAVMAVFIAGLMVGRTPEYLGKKIEAFEVKMAAVAILVPPLAVLVGAALAVSLDAGRAGILNPGAHGFSEVLYALSSAGNNNGSAFAGLSANTPFYNGMLGLAMLMARYWLVIAVLAIAGSLAAKKIVPASAGTLPTHTPLFVLLLIGSVIVVGALTFLPALALGPVVEQLQMLGVR